MTVSRQPIRTLVPAYLLIILANVGGALLIVPISLQLLINTCSCVYIGCLLSTCLAKDSKGHVLTFSKSLGEDESVISMADAKRFPLMASAFLFGFYLLFKVLPKEVFTSIINVYFSLTTVLSVSSIFVEYLPFTDSQRRILFSSNVPSFIQNILEIKKFEVSPAKILCLIGASLPVGFYFLTRHWSLNNIFAILFSLVGLKSLSLSTTKTGLFLMWALFFYDIFWVYGTDVMVTVAKNLDIPIKILFPYLNAEGDFKTSMVGLGDIVIPGIFVSLCLKFDIEAAFEKNKEIKEYSQIELPYFNMCLVGYFYGIIETFLAMFIFEHPQPALLFLVPMCTIPVLIRAFFRGEFLKFVEYDTELKVIEEQSGEKKQD
jgi:minor histocompatibility antigen H13